MVESLLSRGFVVEKGPQSLTSIKMGMFRGLMGTGASKRNRPDHHYAAAAGVVEDHLRELNITCNYFKRFDIPVDCSFIHLATPTIAARLLDRGAALNALAKHLFEYSRMDLFISSQPYPFIHHRHLIFTCSHNFFSSTAGGRAERQPTCAARS